jgi:hypothetical protein
MKKTGQNNIFALSLSLVLVYIFIIGAGIVQAQNPDEEIYLSDTGVLLDFKTTLYRVNLNTVNGRAELTPLPDAGYGPGAIPFDSVVAFACTPDGNRLYCIDSMPSSPYYNYLGVYDLTLSTFDILGKLLGMGFSTQQAAFSQDGFLYIGSQQQDELYRVGIDPASPDYLWVVKIGQIRDPDTLGIPDVFGGDIVFDADGILHIWINYDAWNAPKGLYALSVPDNPGFVDAAYSGSNVQLFTGLAVRANGFGDLVGSITSPTNSILVIDKETGAVIADYPMFLNGKPHDYQYGDMSVGSLELCTKTIGYWKNHPWNGTGITICGVLVREEDGKDILWSARGNNFSMLFAQLIAAKLNTNNSTGIPEIEAAENYICTIWAGGWQDHVNDSIPKSEKKAVTALWRALDAFNNQFGCE